MITIWNHHNFSITSKENCKNIFYIAFYQHGYKKNTYIKYEIQNKNNIDYVEISADEQSFALIINFDKETTEILQNNNFLKTSDNNYIIHRSIYDQINEKSQTDTATIQNLLFQHQNMIFLPAERASLTVIPDQIMALLADKSPFLKNYIENINAIKDIVTQGLAAAVHYLCQDQNEANNRTVKTLTQSIDSILCGEYRKLDDGDFIVNGKTKVRVSESSSGQQDIIWPLLLTFASILQQKQIFLVIEEPEAHLYPETQARFLEILAILAKANPGNHVILTTHSPYILEACNNLIQAGLLGCKHRAEADAIVAEPLWINLQHVRAYMLNKGKKATNIVSKKLGRIESEKIDGISGEFNRNFDRMMELAYAKQTKENNESSNEYLREYSPGK